MKNMTITTESGAQYVIENGICVKVGSDGYVYEPFKVWEMYGLPKDIVYYEDAFKADKTFPVTVGHRLFAGGKDNWWISTEVTSIEELND